MTTLPPHIDATQVAQETKVQDVTAPTCGTTLEDLPDQYTMARRQYLSFTQEKADQINQTLDLIEACANKRITPNKLFKEAALQKARWVLNQGVK